MGRYAFFNTELEYKFAFGIQPSEDIQEFGGTDISDYKNDGPRHKWTEDDREDIKFELQHMEDFYQFEPFDFSKYKKDVDGTYNLRHDFEKIYKELEELEVFHYKYMLGLMIYHQLEYMCPLTVSYEL
jgi:hypothetical protein